MAPLASKRHPHTAAEQPRDEGVLSGSLCDLIFSGVFERHPRLTLAIVEFELAWAPHLLSTMDDTYRERHGEALYRFKRCYGASGEDKASSSLDTTDGDAPCRSRMT
jgi:hypothetical protein